MLVVFPPHDTVHRSPVVKYIRQEAGIIVLGQLDEVASGIATNLQTDQA
jgi:hypothetical protein